jgi:hypothetical protein
MKIRMHCIAVLFVLISISVAGQQKYKGTIVTKMGDQQTGLITVNLAGENNEMILIEPIPSTKAKSKKNKSSQTTGSSIKLNLALIHHIIINDTTYYFRDIKYDYQSKYHMNTCVRLIEGTLDCGYFQGGDASSPDYIAMKLPNDEFSKLVSINFDYYKATLGWHIMAFSKCASLKTKMEQHLAGYTWDDNNTTEQRLEMWRNWIKEYNGCK